MKPAIVIENPSDLGDLIRKLEHAHFIAIDTESNSFHAYFEKICLLQISDLEEDYILDPLALDDLSPLRYLLANSTIEKVFHAASNDILGIRRDFEMDVDNLFDTAIAAKMLGYSHLGLATILEEHFGIHLDKKLQRHNWGRRPLSSEQISYARLDTHYLIPLRHRLAEELQEKGLWEQALQAFHKASAQECQERVFQPQGFLRLRGAHSLDAIGKSVLQTLYLFRDHEARRKDRAPFRVFSNEALVKLARCRPSTVREFSRIKGVPRPYRRGRAAQELLEAIRRAEDKAGEPAAAKVYVSEDALCDAEKAPRGCS